MAKHRPVNKTLAQECMAQYKKIHQNSSDPEVKKGFTDGVVFDKAELIAWLNAIPTPSVKICMGVYTPAFVQKYPAAKEGRLTTFIFPSTTIPPLHIVKAGGGDGGDPGGDPGNDPNDPLNVGGLEP